MTTAFAHALWSPISIAGAALTPKEKTTVISKRQVEEHSRCFLFGHYDSRGGATLVRAKNLLEAFEKYACEAFGWTKDDRGELQDEGMRQYMKDDAEYEAWRPDSLHQLMEEDFMFSCNVIVCDEPFGDKDELDFQYTGDAESAGGEEVGYRYGVLQYRWKHKPSTSAPRRSRRIPPSPRRRPVSLPEAELVLQQPGPRKGSRALAYAAPDCVAAHSHFAGDCGLRVSLAKEPEYLGLVLAQDRAPISAEPQEHLL